MNYLKSKRSYFIAFSMVFAFIAFLMVGCEKDVSKTIDDNKAHSSSFNDLNKTNADVQEYEYFSLPKGYEEKNETELVEYFQSLTIEEKSTLQENYRIKAYLESIGKLTKVETDMKKGDLFTNFQLKNYLSYKELVNLTTFKPSETKLSSCASNDIRLSYVRYECESGECVVYEYYQLCVYGDWVPYPYNPVRNATGVGCGCGSVCDPYVTKTIHRDRGLVQFLNNDLDNNIPKLSQAYIQHHEELSTIFNTNDAEYANAQQAFNEFWKVYEPISHQVFAKNETLVLEQYHIELATNLLSELSKVSQSDELQATIDEVKANIHIMEGKELKQALKTFDKLGLEMAK